MRASGMLTLAARQMNRRRDGINNGYVLVPLRLSDSRERGRAEALHLVSAGASPLQLAKKYKERKRRVWPPRRKT